MLEPVIAKVPVRRSLEAEFIGRVERSPAPPGTCPGAAGTVLAVLDVIDIVLAAALQRVFTAIKA